MSTKGLPKRLPPRTRIVMGADGKTYLTGKSRRRYKTPAAVRKKIAAGARRFKVPVLTTAAVAAGTWEPIKNLVQGNAQEAGRILLRNYTGVDIQDGSASFNFRYMLNGLVPILVVGLVRRTGVFKKVNTTLAKSKIPLRLS